MDIFLVKTNEINNVLKSQSTLTLNSLRKKLNHFECKYHELKDLIKTVGKKIVCKN